MSTARDEQHLTDVELMRILDGEGPGPDAGDPGAHLEVCHRCVDALEELRADSQLISHWLVRADFETPTAPGDTRVATDAADAGSGGARAATRPLRDPTGPRARPASLLRSPWLRAAAVLVLVAAPLAAFPGVRAWVAEQVSGSDTDGGAAMAGPEEETPMVLRFTPDPGAFMVRFPLGATGTITVERSDDGQAELAARGGDPEAVVGASSLEIRNEDEGRYRLRLPAAVTGVWVRVGERAVALTGAQIDRRAVVDLGPRFSQPVR